MLPRIIVLKIKWLGTCETCSMSSMTMKAGIESTIKAAIPEIVAVEAVKWFGIKMVKKIIF